MRWLLRPMTRYTAPMSRPDPNRRSYWRWNLVYLAVLLTLWFTVSFLFGIVFVDELDRFRIGGFKLGFWFAQQGSIFVFVVLIFAYVGLMKRLDRKQHLEEHQSDASSEAAEKSSHEPLDDGGLSS